MFILSHSIKWVPNIWELKQVGLSEYEEVKWPRWIGRHNTSKINSKVQLLFVDVLTYFSHLLTAVNCSANVFIYLVKHRVAARISEEDTAIQTRATLSQ